MAAVLLAGLAGFVLVISPTFATAPVEGTHSVGTRSFNTVSTLNRKSCENGETSSLVVDTTERLQNLREEMKKLSIDAYIVSSTDDHQSEYIANHDKRREYISGFTGSNGDAVITMNEAALWTDSRYYILAEQLLDCNWSLMKSGIATTPTIKDWLVEKLSGSDSASVSADPRIVSYTEWNSWNSSFGSSGIEMKLINENLIDNIWGEAEGREAYPDEELIVLDTKFAGLTWQEKLESIRAAMEVHGVDLFVVTALDEIAWILNLRGGDVPYTPVFRSYLVIGTNFSTLYLPEEKKTTVVTGHLNSEGSDSSHSIRIETYEKIWEDLPVLGQESNQILLPSPFSYAGGASYYVYSLIPEEKLKLATSPILLMKDIKNDVEAQGMRNAHIRDAVAVCQMLRMLEEGVSNGEYWDELQVVSTLDDLRMQQLHNKGPSFTTISAFGPNAALPHYTPTADTNLRINTSSVFMLDSGGQYLDGTTDITRTIHLGTPTDFQRTVYTELLKGCIDLVSVRFPQGQTLSKLEIILRAPLYSEGLDYGHGSTHGIGSFLGVHEAFDTTYNKNFFGSQEPGFYEADNFGMRLENIVTVVSANLTYEEKEFFTFEPVTLVPYEKNMIDVSLLSSKQLQWLNNYHQKVRQIVGDEMLQQNLQEDYNWLLHKTEPISIGSTASLTSTLNTAKWCLLTICILFSSALSSV